MLRQFLVGGGVSVLNIAIHALVMTTVVRIAQVRGAQTKSHSYLLLMAVMIPTVFILMMTHTFEVLVWSFAYSMLNVASASVDLVILRSSTTQRLVTVTCFRWSVGDCSAQ
jgi:hypothetical protein